MILVLFKKPQVLARIFKQNKRIEYLVGFHELCPADQILIVWTLYKDA
jgi:hypothetical protein